MQYVGGVGSVKSCVHTAMEVHIHLVPITVYMYIFINTYLQQCLSFLNYWFVAVAKAFVVPGSHSLTVGTSSLESAAFLPLQL